MITFEQKNFKVEIESTELSFMEKMETLQTKLTDKLNKQPEDVKFSEKIRYVANCYFDFFENLFGEGTCNAMFGESVSIRECDDAYLNLISAIRQDNKEYEIENQNRIAQITGNRQARRAKK